jgi:hypothetical protein
MAKKQASKAFIDPPADGDFAQAVLCDTRQEMIDNVITTGSLGISPLLVSPRAGTLDETRLNKEIVALSKELLASFGCEIPVDEIAFETAVVPYDATLLTTTANFIAKKVNVLTDRGGKETKRLAKDLATIVKPLAPTKSNTLVATAKAALPDENNDGETLQLNVTLFLNTKTGEAVVFYMREGTM